KMIPKFAYVLLFLFLTTLHVCSHLIPIVEANASIKTVDSVLVRKLCLNVGYEYNHTMLWQSLVNSFVLIYGCWRCDREAERLLAHGGSHGSHGSHGVGATKLSPAAEVKLNWMRSKGKLPFSWKLFPLSELFWYTLPWLFTFVGNGVLNYWHLNMIMGHFCTSPLEVFKLYSRVQWLYLQNIFSGGLAPFLMQFNGAFESLLNKHANYISYDSDLLV
ncbi:hypothetical protein KR222_001212, partial [Zaprionus bogoriensis]